MKTSHLTLTATLLAALAATAVPARAANILWGTATTISADSNVLNTGITVGAFRLGSTGLMAATCNGVTFAPIGVADGTTTATSGNFTLTYGSPDGTVSTNTACGSTAAPYSNLPAATQNLLQSGSFSGDNLIVLTMSGLTVGQGYTFEWWTNNAGNFTGTGFQAVRANPGTTASATDSVSLRANTSSNFTTAGYPGQFVSGTFTADATSQSIAFASTNDYALLNAFELRTVPEPSTWAAVGVGAGLLGVVTYRRRAGRA